MQDNTKFPANLPFSSHAELQKAVDDERARIHVNIVHAYRWATSGNPLCPTWLNIYLFINSLILYLSAIGIIVGSYYDRSWLAMLWIVVIPLSVIHCIMRAASSALSSSFLLLSSGFGLFCVGVYADRASIIASGLAILMIRWMHREMYRLPVRLFASAICRDEKLFMLVWYHGGMHITVGDRPYFRE